MEQIIDLTQNPFLANTLQLFLNPAPYFLILVFIFLVIFFYGMNAGRGRTVLLLLSLYVGMILTGLFPYEEKVLENLQIAEPFFLKAGLFIAAILVSFVLLLRSPLRFFAVHEKGRSPILQILLLSVIVLGIFVSYLTTILPEKYLADLDHPVFEYFKTQNAQFWWSLAGMLGLALIRRRE